MKKTAALICLLFVLHESVAQENFHWLIGNWKLENKSTYETWVLNEDNILSGRAIQIKGSDTLVTEVITLEYYDGAFHYIPDVAGDQLPVDFTITSSNGSGFVAENPQHDFPKKITYLYSSKDQRETIRATIEGGGKSITYSFFKVQ